MKPGILSQQSTRTSYIHLDTGKCKACWKCIENCTNRVINKVDLPWHKHSLIVEPDACTGCLNCIKICQYGAFSKNDGAKQKIEHQRKRTINNFIINSLLFVFGVVMIFSGLVLQIGFHMGGHDGAQIEVHRFQPQSIQYEKLRGIDTTKIVAGFNYPDWSSIHKLVIVCISLLMICHTYLHWKWYKGVIAKHLIGKNIQITALSVLFLLVAVTGFVPWWIDLSHGSGTLRLLFIEIHDKITIVLIVFLILHMTKRVKWFIATYEKLF